MLVRAFPARLARAAVALWLPSAGGWVRIFFILLPRFVTLTSFWLGGGRFAAASLQMPAGAFSRPDWLRDLPPRWCASQPGEAPNNKKVDR